MSNVAPLMTADGSSVDQYQSIATWASMGPDHGPSQKMANGLRGTSKANDIPLWVIGAPAPGADGLNVAVGFVPYVLATLFVWSVGSPANQNVDPPSPTAATRRPCSTACDGANASAPATSASAVTTRIPLRLPIAVSQRAGTHRP